MLPFTYMQQPAQNEAAESAKAMIRAIDRYFKHLATTPGTNYLKVPIQLFIVSRMPDVDIFLQSQRGEPKIFRPAGSYMSQVEFDTLVDNGTEFLFIRREATDAFTPYVELMLSELPPSSDLADEQKVTLLRKSSIQIMNDIFQSPTPENINRGVKSVTGFVYVLMKDPRAYGMLLQLSSHDPYTLQHSVGVATNSIILAAKSGIKDEKSLIEVGVGGLLHDIGKTKVPAAIINKKGPLDAEEWKIMKQHSQFSYEIIKDNPAIGTRAKLAALQHHEEPAGGGYPLGIKNEEIDQYAKIVALADIYNALTTDRSYSTAKAPFEAFKIIRDKLNHKVDPKLFETMVLIYGGKS